MAPPASARKATDNRSAANAVPTRVPTNVGPPPTRPARPSHRQDGRTPSAARGPTIPNPSVAEVLEGPLEQSEGVLEDLEQQEQEDPRRQAVEEGLEPGGPSPQPPNGQSQEDGEPGHGAESDGLPCGDGCSFERERRLAGLT